MRDAVFVIRVADGLEAKFAVEPHQVHLRTYADRFAGEQIDRVHDGFAHKRLAQTRPADPWVSDNSTNRWFGILDSGCDNTRIGVKSGVLIASQQMPARGINAIRIDIGAILLKNEDSLTQLEKIV